MRLRHLLSMCLIVSLVMITGCQSNDSESSDNSITAFTFEAANNSILNADVIGTIDQDNKTISVSIPYNKTVTSLVATFATSGDSVTVDGVAQTSGSTANDFTNAVTYTVTAEDDSTREYTVTATVSEISWIHDAYLKASNAEDSDYFGYSVAVSGDLIVVGAYDEDNSSTAIDNTDNGSITEGGTTSNTGAAYVYKKDGDNWVQDAYLKASNVGLSFNFGRSVAISGDLIVVGAEGDYAVGAAYVFKRDDDGNWVQDGYLKASNPGESNSFGNSVAISGELIVVGAKNEGNSITSTAIDNDDGSPSSAAGGASYSGAAYVFKKDNNGNWVQDAYLKASNAESGDIFGSSVAISGKLIVVGAESETNNSTAIDNTDNGAITDDGSSYYVGAAYVFKRDNDGNWVQDAYLKAFNADTEDSFGASVGISGELIVVGATLGGGSGAAYVFKRDNDGNWVHDAYLKASNAEDEDLFGYSVAISGDLIVVGAVHEDNTSNVIYNINNYSFADTGTGNRVGAAYVFRRDDGGDWVQDAYLKTTNSEDDDLFGNSVAVSGDLIVVGAYQEDNSSNTIVNTDSVIISDAGTASDSGAAYIFK